MSWMDSWSRPNKSQATPAPYYLTQGDNVPYCHTCGRVIGQRRANASTKSSSTNQVKYCSDKCKKHKPPSPTSSPTSLEQKISETLLALLQGHAVVPADANLPAIKAQQKPTKGDPRILVKISEIEMAVFGNRADPEKVFGRRKNRRARFVREREGEWRSVDMEGSSDSEASQVASTKTKGKGRGKGGEERARSFITATTATTTNDDDDDEGGRLSDDFVRGVDVVHLDVNDHVRLPQEQSEANFSVGGERGCAEKIEETPEMLVRRREGQKKAEEKEIIKQAARRAVVFGLLVDAPSLSVSGSGSGLGAKGGGKRGKGARAAAVTEEVRGEGEGEGHQEGKVRRKCECLMNGQVVEPSFAKGDWEVRWRED